MTSKAASINGIDWERIRHASVEAAEEIAELGRRMDSGLDSNAEFSRLCELLIKYGEAAKAKALLIANVEEGDTTYQQFASILHEPERLYESAVSSFERQYSSKLLQIRKARFLSDVYRCVPSTSLGEEVHITLDTNGELLADAYDPSSSEAVQLRFCDGVWSNV